MIYLLALLGVIGCMLLVDRRFELFLWHRPLPALLVLAAGGPTSSPGTCGGSPKACSCTGSRPT